MVHLISNLKFERLCFESKDFDGHLCFDLANRFFSVPCHLDIVRLMSFGLGQIKKKEIINLMLVYTFLMLKTFTWRYFGCNIKLQIIFFCIT